MTFKSIAIAAALTFSSTAFAANNARTYGIQSGKLTAVNWLSFKRTKLRFPVPRLPLFGMVGSAPENSLNQDHGETTRTKDTGPVDQPSSTLIVPQIWRLEHPPSQSQGWGAFLDLTAHRFFVDQWVKHLHLCPTRC